jgi:hypothetical protein
MKFGLLLSGKERDEFMTCDNQRRISLSHTIINGIASLSDSFSSSFRNCDKEAICKETVLIRLNLNSNPITRFVPARDENGKEEINENDCLN